MLFRLIHIVAFVLLAVSSAHSQSVTATDDSTRVAEIIYNVTHTFDGSSIKNTCNTESIIVEIGKQMLGIPYVGKTLEVNPTEQLVINLRQLDCTTFVENVLAIYLTIKAGSCSFDDFKSNLRRIRYNGGVIAYENRLHYFTSWIDNAEKQGIANECHNVYKHFNGSQQLNISFMTTNPALYPMMNGNSEIPQKIKATEKALTGRIQHYIPKRNLNNPALKTLIHNGDIIVIVTNKPGLDTSHIGLAVWQKGTLHLMNASSIHKKVVVEPMTLYQYMQRHPSQIGIRVVRIN